MPSRTSVLANLALSAGAKSFLIGWKARRAAVGLVNAEVRSVRARPLYPRHERQYKALTFISNHVTSLPLEHGDRNRKESKGVGVGVGGGCRVKSLTDFEIVLVGKSGQKAIIDANPICLAPSSVPKDLNRTLDFPGEKNVSTAIPTTD